MKLTIDMLLQSIQIFGEDICHDISSKERSALVAAQMIAEFLGPDDPRYNSVNFDDQ